MHTGSLRHEHPLGVLQLEGSHGRGRSTWRSQRTSVHPLYSRAFAGGRRMESDRRSFLRAAGSSLLLGAGSVWSAAAQAPASPVSFPGIANPLEGSVEVIATGYIWTEGPVWVGGEGGHLLFSDVPGNA